MMNGEILSESTETTSRDHDDGPARTSGAQTLERALGLIEAVSRGNHGLEELSAATGLTRSTAHRLLTVLIRKGMLRHGARGGYFLGPRLIEYGFAARDQLHLPSLARPHLEALAELTGETVHLAVRDGHHIVYVDKIPGRRSLQMASYIGARLPIQTTALGKAIAACLPRGEWQTLYRPGLGRTARSVDSPAALAEELERTAQRGYAIDDGENEDDIICIGTAIKEADGHPLGAISVTSAAFYLDEGRIRELGEMACATAHAISAELGWRDAEDRYRG